MTAVEKFKEREVKNRARLREELLYTEEDFAKMIFEGAYQYLEKVFSTDSYGMEHLPKTKEFWAWWKIEWAKIDAVFIGAIEEHNDRTFIRDRDKANSLWSIQNYKELRDQYAYYHEATMKNRYMNSSLVRAGAHEMVNAITHSQSNNNTF